MSEFVVHGLEEKVLRCSTAFSGAGGVSPRVIKSLCFIFGLILSLVLNFCLMGGGVVMNIHATSMPV